MVPPCSGGPKKVCRRDPNPILTFLVETGKIVQTINNVAFWQASASIKHKDSECKYYLTRVPLYFTVLQSIVRCSARKLGKSKKCLHTAKKSRYPLKYHGNFCPAVKISGIIPVCYKLSFSFYLPPSLLLLLLLRLLLLLLHTCKFLGIWEVILGFPPLQKYEKTGIDFILWLTYRTKEK